MAASVFLSEDKAVPGRSHDCTEAQKEHGIRGIETKIERGKKRERERE